MNAPSWKSRLAPLFASHFAPLGCVVAGYFATRAIFWWFAGVAFDASSLDWFWQYIDPELLANDALASVALHHAQPPLFNLYLAGVLKLSGGEPRLWFWASYVLVGAALHAGLFLLLRDLGVGVRTATVAAIVYAASPVSILYESWLFYTPPLAALLVFAAWFLLRLVRGGGRAREALLFFGLLATAGLTRSLFHPVWILGCVALPLCVRGIDRRRVLLAAALPLVLVAAVVAKNGFLFGSFATSSWMGNSLARLALVQTPPDARRTLVENGALSELSLIRPFSPLRAYPPRWRTPRGIDHPVLRSPLKTSGQPNFNHEAFIAISAQYQRDSLAMIGRAPGAYLRSVGNAWLIYAMPPSDYTFMKQNRTRIAGYDAAWNCVVYGACTRARSPDGTAPLERRAYLKERFTWTWNFALIAALLLAGSVGLRGFAAGVASGRDAALLFIAGTTVFVACAGNFLELGENNRFRALLEPISWASIVWAAHYGVERFRGRVPRTP
jgi:hypothetical protein